MAISVLGPTAIQSMRPKGFNRLELEPGNTIRAETKPKSLDPSQHPSICNALSGATADTCDLIPGGSNYTFLVNLSMPEHGEARGIYKPQKGEAPLWDFPLGTLYKREYAAYLISEVLGWYFVPPTVIWDGPYGIGSLQLFIKNDASITYFELRDAHPQDVKRIATFDLLVNNTDRKGGHCIRDLGGKVWGIDHGLTFNVEPKLRTVIWDFGGESISSCILNPLERELAIYHSGEGLSRKLEGVLSDEEIDLLAIRITQVIENPVFPTLKGRWEVPWPLV